MYVCFVVQCRELQIAIYWKDQRQMCAVKFLRLEDFLDDQRHGMAIHLEPQGILFAEVTIFSHSTVLSCFVQSLIVKTGLDWRCFGDLDPLCVTI